VDEERNQQLSGSPGVEGDGPPRPSRPSLTLGNGQASEDPRRKSRGQYSPPLTPHRVDSSSSTMSRAASDRSEGDQSPLRSNPWRLSTDDIFHSPFRPRLSETTESTPLLPSEARGPDPSPSGHPNRPPPGPAPHDRPSTIKRDSISRMMPGPLISPLSSPLSAIVADSLRRHGDSAGGRRRPRPSGLRPLPSYQIAAEAGSGGRSRGTSPAKGSADPSGADDEGRERRRQSIAAAFGDLFRPKRDRGQEGSRGDGGGVDHGERRFSSFR
jgi:hypothetical protein